MHFETLDKERAIVSAIFDQAEARDLLVSVYGEEGQLLSPSLNRLDWERETFGGSGIVQLRFRHSRPGASGQFGYLGSVTLIFGNGSAVVEFATDTREMDELMAPAMALSEKLFGRFVQ